MGRPRKTRLGTPDSVRLKELQARYRVMFALLRKHPSDEDLSREVRHIEVDIVRLTGEKTMDY
jgi:hypothetical protein